MAHFERSINEKKPSVNKKSFQFYPRSNCNKVNCTGKECQKNGWFNHPDKPICWGQFCGIHPTQDVKNRHIYETVSLDHARNYCHPLRTEEGLYLSDCERQEAFIKSIKELWSDEKIRRKAPDDDISPPTPLRISFLEFLGIPIDEDKAPPKAKARPKHQPKQPATLMAKPIALSQSRFGILGQEPETEEINSSKAGPSKAGSPAPTTKANLSKAAGQPAAKAKAKAASSSSGLLTSPPSSPPPKAEPALTKSQGTVEVPSKTGTPSKDSVKVIDVTSSKNIKRGVTEELEIRSKSEMPTVNGDATADEKMKDVPQIPVVSAASVASTFIVDGLSGTEPITVDTIISKLPSDEDEIDKMIESIKKSNDDLKAEAEAEAKARAARLRIEAKKNELAQCILLQRQLLQATENVKANQ